MCLTITRKKDEINNLSVMQSDYEVLHKEEKKEIKLAYKTKHSIVVSIRKFLKKIKILKFFYSSYLKRKINQSKYLENNKNFKKFLYENI